MGGWSVKLASSSVRLEGTIASVSQSSKRNSRDLAPCCQGENSTTCSLGALGALTSGGEPGLAGLYQGSPSVGSGVKPHLE